MSSHTQVQDDAPAVPETRLGPDLTGQLLLGRYKIVDKLGHGGMGTVYVGEHTAIGKKFAIKVLGNDFAQRPDLVERFLREARAASMIPQQNVVEITDFGDTPGGSVFFVMEYLDGEDLRQMLKREGRLPWLRIQHMIVQICKALQAAHDKGIIHRDMKPDNCFRITREGDEDFIKVLDFGIAKIQTGEGGKGLTQTGMLFGTPEYMSPEQAQGAAVDHRSDIYAVGVIMYQLLCGKQPFTGETFMAVLTQHMFETPVAPSEIAPDADIPFGVEAIVLKAMQKDPQYRFQSMKEMIEAIETVGTGYGTVEVVVEHIARPQAGPTTFVTAAGAVHHARPTPVPGGPVPTGSEETMPQTGERRRTSPGEPESSGRLGLWLGGVSLVIALVVGAYVLFGGSMFAPKPEARVPAPVAAPAPTPAPTPATELDAVPASLRFSTNVSARILDARDRAIYGSTDDEGGLELPLSSEPMKLILVAEGYEELEIEVVPDREQKQYDFELTPVEVELVETEPVETVKGGKGGKTKSKGKTAKGGDGGELPKSSGGTKLPSKGSNDGEVKNPFAK